MRRRYTEEQRTELIDLVKSGQTTVVEAAARLGVITSTAYSWTSATAPGEGERHPRRARAVPAPAPSGPTFVQVVPSSAAGPVAVRVGAAEIQVRRGFDPDLLRAIVEALGGAA